MSSGERRGDWEEGWEEGLTPTAEDGIGPGGADEGS